MSVCVWGGKLQTGGCQGLSSSAPQIECWVGAKASLLTSPGWDGRGVLEQGGLRTPPTAQRFHPELKGDGQRVPPVLWG